MNQTGPRSIVYAQLVSGLAFIGRLPLEWKGPELEEQLVLTSALQVLAIPMPMQTPHGVQVGLQTTLVPCNHMVNAPVERPLPWDMCLTIEEVGPQHPLAGMYVQRTSGIVLPGAGG